jgi:hypothetical protein
VASIYSVGSRDAGTAGDGRYPWIK